MRAEPTLPLALLAAILASPALAGGPGTPAPEPVVIVEPSVAVAYSDWTGAYAGVQLGYGSVSASLPALDGDGVAGGVHAGFRRDYGTFVLGIEAEWDAANIDLGVLGDKLNNVGRLKLSAGYDTGGALIYALAGAAHASATLGGVDRSDHGWILGAGAAVPLSDQWTFGAELIGHRFDDFDGSGVDLDTTTAQLRLDFRF